MVHQMWGATVFDVYAVCERCQLMCTVALNLESPER